MSGTLDEPQDFRGFGGAVTQVIFYVFMASAKSDFTAAPLIDYIDLDKSLYFSEPQFCIKWE